MPGDDVGLWTAEWFRWNLPQTEWRVAVLPGWGVLTIVPPKQTPAVTPRAVPLGRIGSRWYLPLHAEILPAVTAAELEALLPADFAAAVFHPARGLLAIETQELRSVSELLDAPPFCAEDWTAAQPGEALHDRLISVQPAALPSLEQVLQSGRGDIGSQSSEIKSLPPRPKEPGEGLLDQAKRGIGKTFYGAVAGLAGMLGSAIPSGGFGQARSAGALSGRGGDGGGAAGPGWLESLANWAAQRLQGISQELEDQRNREIKRLMHLLQNNPDEGLKFALPFGGGEHRGLAAPSGSLGSRDVNFNLNRLGGGGAADFWNLSPQYQMQLMQRYRELANRELQLGRHRRAAYIFAELLGDFEGAASALQAGEHWREAAVLYRDKLHRPKAAAECLERGGLLHEAIALYEPLQEFEKIGDLYERLSQQPEAITAWQTAADHYEDKEDFFKSAGVHENKIKNAEAAEQVLRRSWNAGHHLRESLEKLFELFVRQQWHDKARARIHVLRDELNTASSAAAGCEALTGVVRTYPDEAIIALAADTTRVVIGGHLGDAEQSARKRLVGALQQLVPSDQLLARDGQRYLHEREVARPPMAPTPKKGTPLKPQKATIVREFKLPTVAQWEVAAGAGSHFFAVGNAHGHVALMLGDWRGNTYTECLKLRSPPGYLQESPIAVDPQGHGPLLVSSWIGAAEMNAEIRTREGVRRALLFDRNVDRMRHQANEVRFAHVGLSYALGRAFFLDQDLTTGQLIANGRVIGPQQSLGAIATTFEILTADDRLELIPTHGRNDLLAVGYENQLLLVRGPDQIERLEFSSKIRQIVGSALYTRTRLAVVTDLGTHVIWLQGRDASQPIACGQDLQSAKACFTLGGRLVLIGANGGEVYETSNIKLTLCHTFANFNFQPLAVLPTDEPNESGLIAPDGNVRVYRLS